MLRTNIMDLTERELWDAYIQLTEAKGAFSITKNDLSIRSIWHQLQHRMESYVLVCFISNILWKTLEQKMKQANLGDEPRRVIVELGWTSMVDVVLPTHNEVEIRRTCITPRRTIRRYFCSKRKCSAENWRRMMFFPSSKLWKLG